MSTRRRVLALVANYKTTHNDYLATLARLTDLTVAYSGVIHGWALESAADLGLYPRAVGTVPNDGWVFVSRALRDYLEQAHGCALREPGLIVPHAYSERFGGPLQPKLSAADGRIHIALVGTAEPLPDHGRWYGDIIRRLVAVGLVVHSHFHDPGEDVLAPYRRLADELADYHCHDTVGYRKGHRLSDLISRYDLMGVFHELDAPYRNEAATLAVCMPTQAVCGWFYGAIPVVCPPAYRGLAERIEEHGIGFVVDRLEDLAAIAADRAAIERASANCRAMRGAFTHEYQCARILTFYERLLGSTAPGAGR